MGLIRVPERCLKELPTGRDYVGLFGLSVGKCDFETPEVMKHYAEFMQNHFAYSVLIIADFPKKYNIMALTGLSEKIAERRVRVAGDNLRNNLEKVTRDFPTVKVARWNSFMTDEYKHNLAVIRDAYIHDRNFRESCNSFVIDFLKTPENKAKWPDPLNPPLDIAKEYLLDELALLIAAPLQFKLPVCEIYPGRNEVHEMVQNGDFEFSRYLYFRKDRRFMEAYYESA